jgi:hypothetical protein
MTKTEATFVLCGMARFAWLEWRHARYCGRVDRWLFNVASWIAIFGATVACALGVFVMLGGRFR